MDIPQSFNTYRIVSSIKFEEGEKMIYLHNIMTVAFEKFCRKPVKPQ